MIDFVGWFYALYFCSIGVALFIGFMGYIFSDTPDIPDFVQNFKDSIRYILGEDVK